MAASRDLKGDKNHSKKHKVAAKQPATHKVTKSKSKSKSESKSKPKSKSKSRFKASDPHFPPLPLLDLVYSFLKSYKFKKSLRGLEKDSEKQLDLSADSWRGNAKDIEPTLVQMYNLYASQQTNPGLNGYAVTGSSNSLKRKASEMSSESESESGSDSESSEAASSTSAVDMSASSSENSKAKNDKAPSSSKKSALTNGDLHTETKPKKASASKKQDSVSARTAPKKPLSEPEISSDDYESETDDVSGADGESDSSDESSSASDLEDKSAPKAKDNKAETKSTAKKTENKIEPKPAAKKTEVKAEAKPATKKTEPKSDIKSEPKKKESKVEVKSETKKKDDMAGIKSELLEYKDPKSNSGEIVKVEATDDNLKMLKKQKIPFSRIPTNIKVEEKFSSNAYRPYDYANKAFQDLSVTKGKGFTKAKQKGKRGSYKGGAIDASGGRGIKFDD